MFIALKISRSRVAPANLGALESPASPPCTLEMPQPEPKPKPFDPKTADMAAYNELGLEDARVWDNVMISTIQVARQTGLDAFIKDVDAIRTIGHERAKQEFKKRLQDAFPKVDFTEAVKIGMTNADGKFLLTLEQDGKSYTIKNPEVIRAAALYTFLLRADSTAAKPGAPKGFAPSAVEALSLGLHRRKVIESAK